MIGGKLGSTPRPARARSVAAAANGKGCPVAGNFPRRRWRIWLWMPGDYLVRNRGLLKLQAVSSSGETQCPGHEPAQFTVIDYFSLPRQICVVMKSVGVLNEITDFLNVRRA